jgi:hypothetical protein
MWNSYDAHRKGRGSCHKVAMKNACLLPTECQKIIANYATGDMSHA